MGNSGNGEVQDLSSNIDEFSKRLLQGIGNLSLDFPAEGIWVLFTFTFFRQRFVLLLFFGGNVDRICSGGAAIFEQAK